MNNSIMAIFGIVILLYFSLICGCIIGRNPIDELKRNGYEIIKHEVRHGDFYTNWVEVIKK